MNKRTKETLWITSIFAFEFAVISLVYFLAYLFPGTFHSIFNPYIGMLIFLIMFGVFYPIYLEFTIFDTTLSILTTTIYSFLWAFSGEVSLNAYYILINITIGAILTLLIWVLHDRLVPLKGVWDKKILTKDMRLKVAAFSYLIIIVLFAYVMLVVLISSFSFLFFIILLFTIAYFVYIILYTMDEAKKYIEKGEKYGKPKPKPE